MIARPNHAGFFQESPDIDSTVIATLDGLLDIENRQIPKTHAQCSSQVLAVRIDAELCWVMTDSSIEDRARETRTASTERRRQRKVET